MIDEIFQIFSAAVGLKFLLLPPTLAIIHSFLFPLIDEWWHN